MQLGYRLWIVLCTFTLAFFPLASAQMTLGWQEGQAYLYNLSVKTHQKVSFEQIARLLDNPSNTTSRPDYVYKYELQSSFLIAPVQRMGADWLMVVKLEAPRLTLRAGEGALQKLDTRSLEKQIESVTCYLQVTPHGEIRSVWFTPQDATEAHDMIRAILARLQVCLAKERTRKWLSEEESPEGRYKACYELQQGTEQTYKLRKYRVSYTEVDSLHPLPQTLKPSDDVSIEITNRLIQQIEGRWRTEALVQNKLIGLETTELKFRLRTIRTVEANRLQLWRSRYRAVALRPEHLRVPERPLSPEQKRLADQQLLGSETYESLQRKLSQLKVDAPFEQYSSLIPAWTALLRLKPELCARLVPQIASLNLRSPQAQVLISALQQAGHTAAQNAMLELCQFYYDRQDAESFAILMANFASITDPSEATVMSLREIAEEKDPNFAYPARLTIGSIGFNLREKHLPRARQIGAWMARQLEQATNDSDREVWLLAIGNLGIDDLLPTVQAYLNHPNESIRAAAVGSLRFMSQAGVDAILIDHLRPDEMRMVKNEVISALQYRTISATTLQAIHKYLQQESDKSLRRLLLEVLGLQAPKNPRIIDVIRWASQNDPDTEVRLYAQSLLLDIEQ